MKNLKQNGLVLLFLLLWLWLWFVRNTERNFDTLTSSGYNYIDDDERRMRAMMMMVTTCNLCFSSSLGRRQNPKS